MKNSELEVCDLHPYLPIRCEHCIRQITGIKCKFVIVNKAVKISSVFPKHLFWDVKIDQLDAVRDIKLIIPRALYFTTQASFESDIQKLEQIYNKQEIVSNLRNTKEKISNRVCEMVAARYHIPVFHRFAHQ